MQAKVAIRQINERAKNKIPFLFVIDFLKENYWIGDPKLAASEGVLYESSGFQNHQIAQNHPQEIIFKKSAISFEQYKSGFDYAKSQILYGNSYLLNFSAPTRIETNLSLKDIFVLSEAKFKLLFKNQFVCFSPETFIQIQDREISTYPMKGTIDANTQEAKEVILNNAKEKAEHNTIVDLLRNDLNTIAKKVKVSDYRYVEEIKSMDKNLLQVSSRIVGQLPENYLDNLGEILFSMLPAGSISGAPKKKTIEIILEAEKYHRGFYTGVMGYFDGKNLNSAVMIRFIERIDKQLYFKSGGGITYLSDAQAEYQELLDKVYLPILRKK